MLNELILVRCSFKDRQLIGATRRLKDGLNPKYWADYGTCDPKDSEFTTYRTLMPSRLADKLVLQGKRSQYFANDFDAYEAFAGKGITKSIEKTPTDTYLECTLKGEELLDYYERHYCVEGGKYYELPEDLSDFENYDKDKNKSTSGVRVVSREFGGKSVSLEPKHE